MAIDIKLDINNIGPHNKLCFLEKVNTLKIGIYANNGGGKTFIGRAFRSLINSNSEYTNKLLEIGKTSGTLNFEINDGKNNRKLNIKIEKNKDALINNQTGYIFHVFNSDYVKENLEFHKYKINGEIEGYILGKSKIDLTKEKEELNELSKKLGIEKERIKEKFLVSKKLLDQLKINKNIKEYKDFTLDSLYLNQNMNKEELSFIEIKKLMTKLESFDEETENINSIYYNNSVELFDEITQMLNEKYTKSTFNDEFKQKIISKQILIEEGISKLSSDNKCPFCEQNLDQYSLKLINDYNSFLENKESMIIKALKNLKKDLEIYEKNFINFINQNLKSIDEFNTISVFIPSFSQKSLKKFDLDKKIFKNNIVDILNCIDKKIENISKEIIEPKINIFYIKELSNKAKQIEIDNNLLIKQLNKMKNDLSIEKKSIKKRLCISAEIETREQCLLNINEIEKYDNNIIILEKDIKEKENQEKTPKKNKLIETFKSMLQKYFDNKYEFNEKNFCLTFNKSNLIDNANDVLSDGEKSIVAFCYYIAESHTIIEKEEEYEKLFFIIDDPISSMDFHYVYSTSQILRTLNEIFKVDRIRYFVLTHNLEFFSILVRNKIIDQKFTLSHGVIKKLKKELIMPYHQHLEDVYNVSNGLSPSHTTPNSIRHILETINKFEAPNKDLKEYCDENDILKDNEFIYSLMHDYSHGNQRLQVPYETQKLINGCKVIVDFIRNKFNGQIEMIK